MKSKKDIDRMVSELADKGILIEYGWKILRSGIIPPNASRSQIDDMRFAYYAGAQHLFASLMAILSPEEEPTDADIKKLDLINEELIAFVAKTRKGINA